MSKITALRTATDQAKSRDGGRLTDRRKSLVSAAQELVTELRGLDRDPTAEEKSVLSEAAAALEELDANIEKANESEETLRKIAGAGGGFGGYSGASGTKGGILNIKSEQVAGSVATKMNQSGPDGIKALTAPGTAITSIPLSNAVLPMGQVSTSVLDVLPSIRREVIYAYMRQTLRENNAAIVAPGALKPTSRYGIERIEQRLKVAAHLSEAIDKYDLEDAAMLSQFVRSELEYGLAIEIERLIVNGVLATDGVDGLLNTSGVQVQPFSGDIITSVRKSITLLETAGYAANTMLIHPADYETLELSRRSDGQFDMGANLPVERGAERVWGLARATSVAVPVGTGVVLDRGSVAVATDGRVDVQWADQIGEAFERNQLVARCETRVGLDVFSPRAVVKVELSAA